MKMIGVEIPGPEVLMPGPVDFTGIEERYYLAPNDAAPAPA